ncbi:hypothetical protein PACILC2_18970 [Paenibacillus cisolokensis]|jgi:hypothetical protein|uniref:DUF6199 domain-containing protein n=2 Tax=Paenibacillus cisolokensis TaxID=1658519 RepID=A0ABQ4N580_9BACL|nr:hypothetical protein PACILC2_18970 [Paenibacillus cisolokensis]
MSVSGMRWKRWLAAGLLALLAAALGACGNGAPRTLTYEGKVYELDESSGDQLAVDFDRISAGRQLSDGGRSFNGSLFLVGMLMLIVGIINVLFPRAMWWLKDGWKFRDAEPSGLALTLGRVSGAVLTIAAFVAIVSSCSG